MLPFREMEEKYLSFLAGDSMVKMKSLLEMEPDAKVATTSVTKGATVGKGAHDPARSVAQSVSTMPEKQEQPELTVTPESHPGEIRKKKKEKKTKKG